jgi:Mrp family chromosome partitioning ATPase
VDPGNPAVNGKTFEAHMERIADSLHDARALENDVFDNGLPERGGVAAAAAVEPLSRRDHARARSHDRTDRRERAASGDGASAAAAAPRRGPSRGHFVRPPSTVAEAYHQYLAGLVENLFVAPDTSVRAVMFMGVESGHDAALLPAAAAEILAARVPGRICLVDANVLAPSLHEHYGVLNEQGLITALADDAPISRCARLLAQGQDSSLWLLPAGAMTGEAFDAATTARQVFSAPTSANRIRELIAAFDYVVIEAPPAGSSEAASLFGGAVDGVVLVAEANVTSRQSVRAAADRMRAAGAHVLGTVLNNRVFPIPETLYRLL